jgi:hypothetical protein
MVPPMKKRKAPTRGPAPFTIGVVKPPISRTCGNRLLMAQPINIGIIIMSPGILNFLAFCILLGSLQID